MKIASENFMQTLIATNVLVYATGADGDRARQQRAIQALRDYRAQGALSVQVLAEVASVLIRKAVPLDTVRSDIRTLEQTWQIVTPAVGTVSLALAGVEEYSMSFWDAMLWATAKHHGLTTILSEDGPKGLEKYAMFLHFRTTLRLNRRNRTVASTLPFSLVLR